MKMASNSIKRFAVLLQTIVLIFLATSCTDESEVLRTNDHEPSSNQMKKINLSQNGYATLSLRPGGDSIQLAADVVNELDQGHTYAPHVHISFRKVNYSNGGNHTTNAGSPSEDIVDRFGVGEPRNIILEGRIDEGVSPSTGQKRIRYVLPIASSSATISSLPNQDPGAGTPNLALSSYYDLTQSSPFNYKGFPTGKYFAEIYSWYGGYDGVISAYNVKTNYLHIGSYSLTKSVVGSGTVTSSGNEAPGGGQLPEESVTLTAIPNNNWEFVEWSGGASGTTNPTSITMDGNKSVTATFRLITRFSIATVVNPSGSGTISLSPAPGTDGKYAQGTLVTATATASSGWQFEYWSGASNSQSNQISFTVNSNTSLAAKFILQSPITGPNGLMPLQSGTYSTSFPGASYFKWSRDGVYLGTGSTKSIQMPEPVYQMVITVDAFDSQNNVIARGRKVVGQI